ncbi:hypothetical protein INR75_06605 [Zunongwangia sp. SCSIO 43204]|uniref:hypothetical protein n=1 Tax=Zunongwangia sp. SCSIO 43204 TaxID=2779359 RepID=UPI001CAA250B|nr:hypothetical protein [Zunongwangia sp. SCSIO 43204]UAB85679.1 hypothetical protein INR75_06605 [Zunongwangia sp. SCSIO 43204]
MCLDKNEITKKQKRQYWLKDFAWYLIGRGVYGFLGLFFYPFIRRNHIRKVVANGTNNWWQKQLWYMINRDDAQPNGIDWNEDYIERMDWKSDTWLKRLRNSYWYNAIRNMSYNFLLSHRAEKGYNYLQLVVDKLKKWNKKNNEWVSVSFSIMAFIAFDDGKGGISNKGSKILENQSIWGKAEAYWTDDAGNIQGMITWAVKFRFLFWNIYELAQIGTYSSGKKDFKEKLYFRFADWKFWNGLTPWKIIEIDV